MADRTQNVSKNDWKVFLICALMVGFAYLCIKYLIYVIIALVLLLALFITLYIKVLKFRTWINTKLHIKKSRIKDQPSLTLNQGQQCIYCGKPTVEPVSNLPKFGVCTACGRVQEY